MAVRWRRKARGSVLEYEQTRAICPDPLRRMTTLLVAASLVLSGLVIADAIRYMTRPTDPEQKPLIAAIVELPGIPEDTDRGDQKIEKVKEPDPEPEPLPEPEPEPQPEPEPLPPLPQPEVPAVTESIAKPGQEEQGTRVIGGDKPKPASGSAYAHRTGEAKAKALGDYGGDAQTENAVERGLAWLIRHQQPDGSWSSNQFNRLCKGEIRCDGVGRWDVPLDVSMTSLAMLCFQGAGSTHEGGKYQESIGAALEYLLKTQQQDGLFLQPSQQTNYYMMYNQGIATFALAELYAMTQDTRLCKPVELAVGFICRAQQTSGSWDYSNAKTGRYDTSITGWQVMALKSAQAAGIEIPSAVIYRCARFIDHVTIPSGEVIYSNLEPAPGRKGPGMVAVGLASAQFMGFTNDDPLRRRQAALLLGHKPDWERIQRPKLLNSVYHWYYATLAMFQFGGREWEQWNRAMKKTLLDHQRRGGCRDGSWDPVDGFWGKVGGRIYATTLNILNLEVYYRYLPVHQSGSLNTAEVLIKVARGPSRAEAVNAIRLLARMADDAARTELLKLAQHRDPQLAVTAALALANRQDIAAVAPLLRQLESDNQFIRYQVLRAMRPMMDKGLAPIFIKALDDPHPMVRAQAAEGLRQYASLSFGFQAEGSERERREAVVRWQDWWAKRQAGEVPEEGFMPWLVLRVADEKGLVVFSTGKKHAAKPGQECSVFRNDRYVGRIRVVSVEEELGIGRVDPNATAGAIEKGDVIRP